MSKKKSEDLTEDDYLLSVVICLPLLFFTLYYANNIGFFGLAIALVLLYCIFHAIPVMDFKEAKGFAYFSTEYALLFGPTLAVILFSGLPFEECTWASALAIFPGMMLQSCFRWLFPAE